MTLTEVSAKSFFSKVVITETCWLWDGATLRHGYGSFRGIGARTAHRVSYIHHKGPIPVNHELDHLCSTPHCVNPAHLEAVTFDQNQARSKIRMRLRGWPSHCKAGHLMDDLNTYWRANGTGRQCRICQRARQSEYAVRQGKTAFKDGPLTPNVSARNKHLYALTADDYRRADFDVNFLEVFYACDNMLPYGQRDTQRAA